MIGLYQLYSVLKYFDHHSHGKIMEAHACPILRLMEFRLFKCVFHLKLSPQVQLHPLVLSASSGSWNCQVRWEYPLYSTVLEINMAWHEGRMCCEISASTVLLRWLLAFGNVWLPSHPWGFPLTIGVWFVPTTLSVQVAAFPWLLLGWDSPMAVPFGHGNVQLLVAPPGSQPQHCVELERSQTTRLEPQAVSRVLNH